jgi:hypothetical protein
MPLLLKEKWCVHIYGGTTYNETEEFQKPIRIAVFSRASVSCMYACLQIQNERQSERQHVSSIDKCGKMVKQKFTAVKWKLTAVFLFESSEVSYRPTNSDSPEPARADTCGKEEHQKPDDFRSSMRAWWMSQVLWFMRKRKEK